MAETKGYIDGPTSNMPVNPPPYSSVAPAPHLHQPGAYVQQPGEYSQQPWEYSQQPGPYTQHLGANPQQPIAYPSQPSGQTVHQVVVAPTVVTALPVGPQPTRITCGACHMQVISRTESEPSSKTHLIAILLCLLGGWCCFCIPYCVDSCMTIKHYCPSCKSYLGSYQF